MIAPWQRQLLQLQQHFDDAAKQGYLVRVTLASSVERPMYGTEEAKMNAPNEHHLRHEYFEREAKRDHDLQSPGLLDDDQIRDLSGKIHKPTGYYPFPWETTRTPATNWAPAKSYSWCGIWGDAEGVQRFVNLACSATSLIPHAISGRDDPLFLLNRPENYRWSADPLSVWAQFLAVWTSTSFSRRVVPHQIEHRIAANKTDLFLLSSSTIALVTERNQVSVLREWRQRYRHLQSALSYENPTVRASRGRNRDLSSWRQVALDLRNSCRRNGGTGRIDRKLLLERIREHLRANPIEIPPGDELTRNALVCFLDNAADWANPS